MLWIHHYEHDNPRDLDFRHRKLWSLKEMIDLCLGNLVRSIDALGRAMGAAQRIGDDFVGDDDLTALRARVNLLHAEAAKMEIRGIGNRMAALKNACGARIKGYDLGIMVNEARNAVIDNLDERYVYFLDEQDRRYFDHVPEWEAALEAFPSVRQEMEDATWCYAFGRFNACVFQCMRAAEHGLRALARERSVGSAGGAPIEHAMWQQVLTEIDKRVKEIGANWSKGPAKDAALSFYSGILGELNALKDMYRNSVSHGRGDYRRLDADTAMGYTRGMFMRLSARVRESMSEPLTESDFTP